LGDERCTFGTGPARQDSPDPGEGERLPAAPAAARVQAKPAIGAEHPSVHPAIIRAGQESDHLGYVFWPAEVLERGQFAELLNLRFRFALQEELGRHRAGRHRDREPLEALAASAPEQGAELLTIQADLTNDSAADEITKATRARFRRIDILVNNSGIGPGSIRLDSWQRPLKFWEITPDQWRRFVAVHTTAPLTLANAVVPEMMQEGWGGSSTLRPASAGC
jgi:hypothetical protein